MVVVVDSLLLSSTSEAVPRRRSKLRANSVSAQSVPVQMCASPGADVGRERRLPRLCAMGALMWACVGESSPAVADRCTPALLWSRRDVPDPAGMRFAAQAKLRSTESEVVSLRQKNARLIGEANPEDRLFARKSARCTHRAHPSVRTISAHRRGKPSRVDSALRYG